MVFTINHFKLMHLLSEVLMEKVNTKRDRGITDDKEKRHHENFKFLQGPNYLDFDLFFTLTD